MTIPTDAPTNDSPCEERMSFAGEAMGDVVQAANGACTTDAECAVVWTGTLCSGACYAPILASRVDAVDDARRAIDERMCINYQEDGCPLAAARCVNVEAVCEAGRCALRQLHSSP